MDAGHSWADDAERISVVEHNQRHLVIPELLILVDQVLADAFVQSGSDLFLIFREGRIGDLAVGRVSVIVVAFHPQRVVGGGGAADTQIVGAVLQARKLGRQVNGQDLDVDADLGQVLLDNSCHSLWWR